MGTLPQHEGLARQRDLSYFIDSMKLKQKVSVMVVAALAVLSIYTVAAPIAVADCGDIKTSIIGDGVCGAKGTPGAINNKSTNAQDNGVWKILIFILQIMTAGVGVLGVAGIVYGAVLYTTAADKAEQTKKAIGVITNVVIGIIAYGLMYLVLNFLIPGGIFT